MSQDKIKKLKRKLKTLSGKPDRGASGREKVEVLNELASALRMIDSMKAEEKAREALLLAEKLDYEKGVALSQKTIGRCYYWRRDYEKALKHHLSSERIYVEIGEDRDIAIEKHNISMAHKARGDYDKALKYALASLEIGQEIGDKRITAECYENIANIHEEQGDYSKALKHHLACLDIREEIGNKREIACSLGNIGNIYGDRGNFSLSLEYQNKARKIFEKIGDGRDKALCYSNIGAAHSEQGNSHKALRYQFKALKIWKDMGDKFGIATICANLGGSHQRLGLFEEAAEYFSKSLKIYEEIGDKRGIVVSCMHIGGVQTDLKNYDSASSHLQRAIQMAHKIGLKKQEAECYKMLSETYEKKADFAQALHYYRKYTDIAKEIINIQENKQLVQMRIKYETEKKEKEAEIHRLKNVELKQEIRERKKAEKELNKHRKHLEIMVQERTAQLRSLTHELSLVEEKQRRKIATYLHDEISQKLALVAFKLESLQEHASHGNAKGKFDELMQILDQTTQRIRSLTFEISPPILYELGFEPAVEWLLENFGKQYGIRSTLKDDGEVKPMSNDTRVLLFQSVRELLVNIAKHAQAENVKVSLATKNHAIQVTVKDDGKGFDTGIIDGKIKENTGFGLFSIKERLDYLNGTMKVTSKIDKGTTVSLQVPLDETK